MDQRDCVPNSSHVPLLSLQLLLLIRCRKAYEPSFDCCSCRFASPSLPYFPDFSRTVNDGKDAVNVSHDETTMIHYVSCDAAFAAGFTFELTVWPLFRQ